MKRLLAVVAAGLLVFSIAGCTSKKGFQTRTDVITIPLVTWGGYAALFAANGGAKPTEDSLFYKNGKFKVALVQEENPANQLQGFANGTYGIIWSTMDMLPLLYDTLSKDTRTIPKVIGIFDYSAGGDGIIVRGKIKSGKELKGKKIVTSQYTPSHYFILWFLKQSGLSQKDVTMIFAADAIAAKDTFINDASIDACVTWSPFIYDITDAKKTTYVKGTTLLTTSAPGNPAHGLIADVYITSAEMVEKHPEIIDAFVASMIEGYDVFNKDQTKVAGQIADLFGIKGGADEVKLMFGDVVIAGKKENKQFFAKAGASSASAIFDLSTELYKNNGDVLPASFSVDASKVLYSDAMLKVIK